MKPNKRRIIIFVVRSITRKVQSRFHQSGMMLLPVPHGELPGDNDITTALRDETPKKPKMKQ
jgi:hypothetical protein